MHQSRGPDPLEPAHVWRAAPPGTVTEPSAPGSSRGPRSSVRPTARPEPLSVWQNSAAPPPAGRIAEVQRGAPGRPRSSSTTRSRGTSLPRQPHLDVVALGRLKPTSPAQWSTTRYGSSRRLQHLLGARAPSDSSSSYDWSGVVTFTSSTLSNWCWRNHALHVLAVRCPPRGGSTGVKARVAPRQRRPRRGSRPRGAR